MVCIEEFAQLKQDNYITSKNEQMIGLHAAWTEAQWSGTTH